MGNGDIHFCGHGMVATKIRVFMAWQGVLGGKSEAVCFLSIEHTGLVESEHNPCR